MKRVEPKISPYTTESEFAIGELYNVIITGKPLAKIRLKYVKIFSAIDKQKQLLYCICCIYTIKTYHSSIKDRIESI